MQALISTSTALKPSNSIIVPKKTKIAALKTYAPKKRLLPGLFEEASVEKYETIFSNITCPLPGILFHFGYEKNSKNQTKKQN